MIDEKYRKFVLSSGREVFLGKNSEQNDSLVANSKRNDFLLHTKEPGSPFVNVGENPLKGELYEAAVFCALKSQDFRDNQGNVLVNVFKKDDCYKEKSMEEGSWGVKKYIDTIKVNKIDILRLKHDISFD